MQFLAAVLDNTSTAMYLTMFVKTQNIMLTMRISDVFQTIGKILENLTFFFFQLQNTELNFEIRILYFRYVKAIQSYIFA